MADDLIAQEDLRYNRSTTLSQHIGDFLDGAIPSGLLFFPSTLNKPAFTQPGDGQYEWTEDNPDRGVFSYVVNCRPMQGVGALAMLASIPYFVNQAFDHPYLLLIPVVTNLMSRNIERQKALSSIANSQVEVSENV